MMGLRFPMRRVFSGCDVDLPQAMPYYEFYCPQSHRIYTFFARSLAHAGKVPRCPDNPEWSLEKRVSRFAVVGRAKDAPGDGERGDPDDPRMEAAMAELEREMIGIDEENPDPRQLGRLMRRMGELTGEPMDEPMREMIARLESGEDPDAVEEKFGDVLGDFDDSGGQDGAPEDGGAGGRLRRLVARKRRPPECDDRVFEMEEWV